MMFASDEEAGYRLLLAGIEQKTLIYGEKTLMAKFRLAKGSTLPRHSHPHEQTGYLLEGRLLFTIGSETCDVKPGDSWCVPGEVEHGVEVVEDAVVLEVFSPVRADYIPAG